MTLKERDLATFNECRSELRSMLALIGIGGVMEILADITQEYGDGKILPPDAFWLNAAAQIEIARERLKSLFRGDHIMKIIIKKESVTVYDSHGNISINNSHPDVKQKIAQEAGFVNWEYLVEHVTQYNELPFTTSTEELYSQESSHDQ
jgi:hypothetical protein